VQAAKHFAPLISIALAFIGFMVGGEFKISAFESHLQIQAR
jgi:hypothetical protein